MSVRVRYAPSPTGLQHIGGVRTALFNYFYARAQGGSFILRIEDTDRERYNDESLQDLFDTFEWLGIEWDEGPEKGGDFGPYVQSERFELYKKYAQQLLDQGDAYYCFCTSERLEELRNDPKNKTFGYDRHCRDLTPEQVAELQSQEKPSVVRFKVPLEGSTEFRDLVLKKVKRKNKDINPDPVLLKSDGFPTYHLANVIDDHLMEITHILRAQEWVPSGALHVLLYKAFGWRPPQFCHLPTVNGKDGKKLSKRHGSTSVCDFKTAGYLPEAIINYISLLGWSFDDSKEFFTKGELEKLFTLEKINKAPAIFDYKKLDWFNGNYIRQKNDGELKELVIPFLKKDGIISDPPTDKEMQILDGVFGIAKERLKLLADISEVIGFLFKDVEIGDTSGLIPKKMDAPATIEILETAKNVVEKIDSLSDEEAEKMFHDAAEEKDIKIGMLFMPLRVAVTGTTMSPPLIESIRLLGIDTAMARIDKAIQLLKKEV